MKVYKVDWSMGIEADSPEEAAKIALQIHRDPNSIATVFFVTEEGTDEGKIVDLFDPFTEE